MTQINGNHRNGNNGNTETGVNQDSRVLTSRKNADRARLIRSNDYSFEQAVVLRQSPFWSRTIMFTLIFLAIFGVIWACVAKIEQVVPAMGQLKPEGTVKDVQAPINGVVKAVYIKDGQSVNPGDLLLTFESVATLAELRSLNDIRAALIRENSIYRSLMNATSNLGSETLYLRGLSPETAFLLKSRRALIADNELLRTQLSNSTGDGRFGADEQQRLKNAQRELTSRTAAASLEVEKIKKQLSQTESKRKDTQASLAIQQQVLNSLQTLANEGGVSKLQYLNQKQQVQNLEAQINQLQDEEKRLQFDIAKSGQEVINTVAVSDKTNSEKISDNKKRIAEIDSQFMRIILENEQKLSDINSKISQTQLNVRYQELRAPVGGAIFDLQSKNPGFVANATQKLLQIVPNENYTAEVFITNKDIGFVRKGMKVDVRIDSFPYSEFGDIKGEVIDVASDALPPDQTHQYYRFPTRVRLYKQSLVIQGKNVSLQSGMSVTANIKIREERTVMSLFTELFTKQVDGLKEVR